jgi:hypothetical protein
MDPLLDLRPYQLGIVVGVDHKIQHFVADIAPSDPRNILRLRYLDLLRDITGRYPVDVICEEAKHGLESIAETLANRGGIRYRNIEMSTLRRAELGIPPLYSVNVPGSEVPSEQKARWTALRESHMIDELLEAIAGARAAMVICGVDHMPALADALRSRFARVEHYDVAAMPWFARSLL